jgi:hypothetical protein
MLRDQDIALAWVVRYYRAHNRDVPLFQLSNGRALAYLTKPQWHFPLLKHDDVNFVCSTERSSAEVDHRGILLRRLQGQRIWDGEILCLRHGILEGADGLRIDLCRGTYFQYATISGKLTREAVACARSPRKKAVIRDTVAHSIGDLQSGGPRAQLLGFAVAFLYATSAGWQVLIQRRSPETGVAGDLNAVVPAYVVEPLEADGRVMVAPFQDFLREASEELYAANHHVDPRPLRADWYLELEDVQRLRTLRESGKLEFEIVGLGFDALTGELNVAAVAVLNDRDVARSELRLMQINWEVTGVEAFDIESDEVEALINSSTMYPTSAFALWCAREWLRARTRAGGSATSSRDSATDHVSGDDFRSTAAA